MTVTSARENQKKTRVSGSLIKSKQRVAEHGEVFTPAWMVDTMLDLVKGESERIDSRFLEPACGIGNFLTHVLRRKLATVELNYGDTPAEKRHFALLAVMCIYGIELLPDNIVECRNNLLYIFAEYLNLEKTDNLYIAATVVLAINIVHGNALTTKASDDTPITFTEWTYLGKGKFQCRDFRFDTLTRSSTYNTEGSVSSNHGRHEKFTPSMVWPPMSVKELAIRMPNHGHNNCTVGRP